VTNLEKIQKIKEWQTNGRFHPLTCGNDSNHAVLVPFEQNGEVKLRCTDCNYVQNYVPTVVVEFK